MLRALVVLALVSLLAGSTAPAQTRGPQRQDSVVRTSLQHQINAQALIRVRGSWGTADLSRPRLVGSTLTYASAWSPAALPPPALPQSLPLDAVDRIEVRRSAAGTGALIGAGIGLAGGLAAGLALAGSLCNDGLGCHNETGGVGLITVASTAAGALVGALIGAPIKKWKTVYRAPN